MIVILLTSFVFLMIICTAIAIRSSTKNSREFILDTTQASSNLLSDIDSLPGSHYYDIFWKKNNQSPFPKPLLYDNNAVQKVTAFFSSVTLSINTTFQALRLPRVLFLQELLDPSVNHTQETVASVIQNNILKLHRTHMQLRKEGKEPNNASEGLLKILSFFRPDGTLMDEERRYTNSEALAEKSRQYIILSPTTCTLLTSYQSFRTQTLNAMNQSK